MITLSGTGTGILAAQYSGDTVYAASVSPAVVTTLSLAPSAVTLSASSSSGIVGGNITLTAQVSGTVTAGTSPTGTVSFYVSGTIPRLLGTASLGSTGVGLAVASLNTTAIPAGTQTVYAVYSGDKVFAASQSGTVSIGLSDYSVVFTPANITLTRGQTGSVVLQVNTSGGFAGNISVSCSPPANTEITCSLSQSTLPGSGTIALSIETQAATSAETHVPGLKTIGGVSLAALVCLLLPVGKKRRLPGMLLGMLAIGLTANMGCSSGTTTATITGGTPLGTVNLTIYTAGSNGTTSISHDYSYQVTIQ